MVSINLICLDCFLSGKPPLKRNLTRYTRKLCLCQSRRLSIWCTISKSPLVHQWGASESRKMFKRSGNFQAGWQQVSARWRQRTGEKTNLLWMDSDKNVSRTCDCNPRELQCNLAEPTSQKHAYFEFEEPHAADSEELLRSVIPTPACSSPWYVPGNKRLKSSLLQGHPAGHLTLSVRDAPEKTERKVVNCRICKQRHTQLLFHTGFSGHIHTLAE